MDQQAAAQARVGTMLRGKWRLEQLLGVGGMAAVYAATHRNASRGAVKMLHPYLSQNTDIRRRFLQEGYAANKVNHPGTVRCLDDDEAEDGAAFVVMELLEGESLEYRRAHAGGSLPVEEVLALADQLLDVLAAAHEAGIIHRDIKPENLFLTHEGQLKVLDFGIARIRGEGAQSTAPGAAMGTPAFMSPEQARGESERIGPATDLWAVGATLHNLLTGTYAHDAATLPELLAALCSREPPALTARWPDAPPSVTRLVGGALRLDPAQRWPGARQMQAVAREAYQEITGGPLSSAARPLPIAFDKTHLSDPPPRAPVTRPEGLTTGAIAASSTRSPASPSVGRRGGLLATGLLVVAGGAGWMLRPAPSPIPPANTASAVPPPTALPSSSGSLASTAQAPHRTTLRIRSASPCVVFVDGTDMGETPQEIGVSPGRHEVRCGTESQSAEVGDGETLVLSFRGETKPSPTSVVPPSTSPKPASPTKPPPASKGPDLLDRRED